MHMNVRRLALLLVCGLVSASHACPDTENEVWVGELFCLRVVSVSGTSLKFRVWTKNKPSDPWTREEDFQVKSERSGRNVKYQTYVPNAHFKHLVGTCKPDPDDPSDAVLSLTITSNLERGGGDACYGGTTEYQRRYRYVRRGRCCRWECYWVPCRVPCAAWVNPCHPQDDVIDEVVPPSNPPPGEYPPDLWNA